MSLEQRPRSARRAWLGLVVLAVPAVMMATDMTVLFLAVASIAADLSPSATQQLWILHVGDILAASLVLTAGRLVDRFGPHRLLIGGLVLYGVASLLAAASSGVEMLIAARALLGAAGVTVMPASMAIARRLFPGEQGFARAVALLMASFSAGMALGPTLGGALLEWFSWPAVFMVNVPVAGLVLAVLLGSRLLPRVPGTGRGRIDGPSVLLSAGGLAGVVYGGQELAAHGVRSWPEPAALVGGALLLAGFGRRQRRLPDPLLDLRLFARPAFTLSLVLLVLVILADAGAELQMAQHLQLVTGLSPLRAGLLLTVPAVVSVVVTGLSPGLLRWWRAPTVIAAGGVLAAAAALVAGRLSGEPATPGWALVLAVSGVAAGIAPTFALGAALLLGSVPEEQTGTATAAQDVGGSLGNVLGLSVGGSVAVLSYGASLPALLPPGVDQATGERLGEGAGPALAQALQQGGEQGQQLAEAVRTALAGATSVVLLTAAAGFVVVSVVALVLRSRTSRPAGPGVGASR